MNWDVTNNFLKDANLLFRKAFTYAGKVECQGRVVYNANKDSVSSEDAEEVMQTLDRMERYDIIGELEGAMNCDKKHDDNVMNVWKTKMKENSYFFPLLSHINTDDYAKGDRSVPEDPKGFVRYIACEMALIYEDLYYYLCEFVRTYKLDFDPLFVLSLLRENDEPTTDKNTKKSGRPIADGAAFHNYVVSGHDIDEVRKSLEKEIGGLSGKAAVDIIIKAVKDGILIKEKIPFKVTAEALGVGGTHQAYDNAIKKFLKPGTYILVV